MLHLLLANQGEMTLKQIAVHNPDKLEPNRLKKYPNGLENDQRIKAIDRKMIMTKLLPRPAGSVKLE